MKINFKKIYIFFVFSVFTLIFLLVVYYYQPGIFGLQREGLEDEYLESYKSCVENDGVDDFNEDLFNSYLRRFNRDEILALSNNECEDGSIECAEQYLIVANQLSFSMFKKDVDKVRKMAKNALSLIALAKRIIGDDLVVRASIELLVATLKGVGLESDAREISKVAAYSGPAKSRYSCVYANNIFYSSIAYGLLVDGEYFDSIFIFRGLLYRNSY
ncbi:hypothetical protein KQ940_07185 [Marinobacterium sp. D7]|uniref:hypothetical protein n=1 Tax=Marinobacterium ramblicola TaxID=2849041 RepID=UPI001C2D506D|nr:hypothetical protein [Marinobacterium ramblicola]MBV1787838.1 hypothetical protein [Marinobacterium ramblicola]